MNDETKYEYYVVGRGVIVTNATMEGIDVTLSVNVLKPNLDKMHRSLEETGEFVFGLGLHKIKKVKETKS